VAKHQCCWGGTWYVQLEEDQMASTLGEIETQGEDVGFLSLLVTERERESESRQNRLQIKHVTPKHASFNVTAPKHASFNVTAPKHASFNVTAPKYTSFHVTAPKHASVHCHSSKTRIVQCHGSKTLI
jgi:hypothetical protein